MASVTIVPLADPTIGATVNEAAGIGSATRTPGIDGASRRFSDSVTRAGQDPAIVGATPPQAADVQARDRVRRSLELEGSRPVDGKPAEGDAILDGLQKLRGAFDQGQARLTEVMNTPTVDARMLLSMQMEMVNYSMLVDMSSKLTGKSTQSFDSLMKGQ